MHWPDDPTELEELQQRLASSVPAVAALPADARIGGCFVCFGRGGGGAGAAGDSGWAGAAVVARHRRIDAAIATGSAGAPYLPGLLAAREGRLLEQAIRSLRRPPEVLLVNATGWDHPRRAGLATQLGWVLDLPTIGVTNRPLVASGVWPAAEAGAISPLHVDGEQVGWWLRTRRRARPLAVSPGWQVDLATALRVTHASVGRVRTPEPIRIARRLAREARYQGTADGVG